MLYLPSLTTRTCFMTSLVSPGASTLPHRPPPGSRGKDRRYADVSIYKSLELSARSDSDRGET